MSRVRIGTRSSPLALYQAELVKDHLASSGVTVEIVKIQSEGDIDTKSPLHKMGSVGVFTNALDEALLNNKIDIAVHSCKDLPTEPPKDLEIIAYLERGPFHDLLIHRGNLDFMEGKSHGRIATGSIRRRAQWKKRYPNHHFEELRGNIATRLEKFQKEKWNAIILSEASLKRLGYSMDSTERLEWMIPAPAQGVIAVSGRSGDQLNQEVRSVLNHKETELMAVIERKFLNTLEGGCSAPIGALVTHRGYKNQYLFKGILSTTTGDRHVEIEKEIDIHEGSDVGKNLANQVLADGGDDIIKEIKLELGQEN